MSHTSQRLLFSAGLVALGSLLTLAFGSGQEESLGFDSGKWQINPGSRVEEFLGRKALTGGAVLKDVVFGNGVIEVDLACKEGRVFPGIKFRQTDDANYEEFYVRPHKSGQPDALQYTPVFNGQSGWQLYYGDGGTAAWPLPLNQWYHIKLEVSGTQARVFIGPGERPALVINDLKHGAIKGRIGLTVTGPVGLTYFSDFKFRHDDGLTFEPPPPVETPLGMLMDWELSGSIPYNLIDVKRPPSKKDMEGLAWHKAIVEPSGLVNISRTVAKGPVLPGAVLSRTTLRADRPKTVPLELGYSDIVSVFLNGRLLFYGRSPFQSRDPYFQGYVGLFDTVFLPLEKGDNELILILTEQTGGWGFICRDTTAVYQDKSLTPLWEVDHKLSYPETVLYDEKRDVLYVSNFYADGPQVVSTVGLDGRVRETGWLKGLVQPTGMAVRGDTLFIVERTGLAEVDLATKEIKRHPFSATGFPNDIAMDDQGNAYITDGARAQILRWTNGAFSVWKGGPEYAQCNGIHFDRGKLYVGFGSDASVREIDVASGAVRTVATLEPGAVVDGMETDAQGNILVSNYTGKIYRITPQGAKTLLLDMTGPKRFCANFAFVRGKNLLIVPTLIDNRVVAYKLKPLS